MSIWIVGIEISSRISRLFSSDGRRVVRIIKHSFQTVLDLRHLFVLNYLGGNQRDLNQCGCIGIEG